jgi:hypothetical protein
MEISCVISRYHRDTCARCGTFLLIAVMVIGLFTAGCTTPAIPATSTKAPAATAAPTPWSGSWDSDWGIMEFTQTGDQVSATYTHNNGRIKGTISGNTLTGTWSESPSYTAPSHAGDVTFTLADDGKSFAGKWRYGSETGKWGGDWKATRK